MAVIFKEVNEAPHILFIRRAEHPHDPWSGQTAFPGGRFEPADRDLRNTAERETREETGLDLASAEYLGQLDEIRAQSGIDLSVTPFVFHIEGPLETHPSSEVRSLHWLSLEALLRPEASGILDRPERARGYPSLRVGDVIIWGLTHRMFMNLRELLGV